MSTNQQKEILRPLLAEFGFLAGLELHTLHASLERPNVLELANVLAKFFSNLDSRSGFPPEIFVRRPPKNLRYCNPFPTEEELRRLHELHGRIATRQSREVYDFIMNNFPLISHTLFGQKPCNMLAVDEKFNPLYEPFVHGVLEGDLLNFRSVLDRPSVPSGLGFPSNLANPFNQADRELLCGVWRRAEETLNISHASPLQYLDALRAMEHIVTHAAFTPSERGGSFSTHTIPKINALVPDAPEYPFEWDSVRAPSGIRLPNLPRIVSRLQDGSLPETLQASVYRVLAGNGLQQAIDHLRSRNSPPPDPQRIATFISNTIELAIKRADTRVSR